MTLTLEDIARLSGVSRSTVSRVINGDENVRQETREHVLDIIQKYNFQPNLAARRLAVGRSNVIGLVIPTGWGNIFNDPYFSRLIQGVSGECNQQEYSLMLWLAEPEFERRMIRQIMNNSNVDGVIISSTHLEDPIVQSLIRSSMPFVMIGNHPGLQVNSIDIDHRQATLNITLHMLTCSKKRANPAIITGPLNTIAGHDRLAGYRLALREAGLPARPEMQVEGNFTEESGYSAMKKLLPFSPDAVFASNDLMAAGAYRALREAGLTIPQDIAITGFDDIQIAAQLDPGLTTVNQPTQIMGAKAVSRLIEVLQNPDNPPAQVTLQPEIIIRASCGCASA